MALDSPGRRKLDMPIGQTSYPAHEQMVNITGAHTGHPGSTPGWVRMMGEVRHWGGAPWK